MCCVSIEGLTTFSIGVSKNWYIKKFIVMFVCGLSVKVLSNITLFRRTPSVTTPFENDIVHTSVTFNIPDESVIWGKKSQNLKEALNVETLSLSPSTFDPRHLTLYSRVCYKPA